MSNRKITPRPRHDAITNMCTSHPLTAEPEIAPFSPALRRGSRRCLGGHDARALGRRVCWEGLRGAAEQPRRVCAEPGRVGPGAHTQRRAENGHLHGISRAGALLHRLPLQARAAGRERYSGNARRAFSTTLYPCGKLGERGTDYGLQIRKGSISETLMNSSLPYYVQSGAHHPATIGDAGNTALTENTLKSCFIVHARH